MAALYLPLATHCNASVCFGFRPRQVQASSMGLLKQSAAFQGSGVKGGQIDVGGWSWETGRNVAALGTVRAATVAWGFSRKLYGRSACNAGGLRGQ